MNPPIARQLNLDETKLPAEIFERLSRRGATLKDYRRRREEAIENFGKPGRDPAELGSVMNHHRRQRRLDGEYEACSNCATIGTKWWVRPSPAIRQSPISLTAY